MTREQFEKAQSIQQEITELECREKRLKNLIADEESGQVYDRIQINSVLAVESKDLDLKVAAEFGIAKIQESIKTLRGRFENL